MKDMKHEKKEKRSAKQNIGFYISLAICIAAIVGAAWTTYGSILEYTEPIAEDEESIDKEQSDTTVVDLEISDEEYENSANGSLEESSEQSSEISDTSDSDEESAYQTVADTTVVSPIENGEIQKIFSPDELIESKTTSDWRTHNGIDISASEGTPVLAITSGTVVSVTKDNMLGNIICINHIGGYTAYYCGVSDTTVVSEGSVVSAGDTIGYVASVPCEMLDESHLHLAVTLDDEYIDPSSLF